LADRREDPAGRGDDAARDVGALRGPASGRRSQLAVQLARRMLEGGLQAVQADEDVVGTSRVRELERRVRELERLLGRKTMEVEILKEALDCRAGKKTELAAAIMERSEGRFAMKAVADTLAVARSNLIERVNRSLAPLIGATSY
jgi:hypothetical protein